MKFLVVIFLVLCIYGLATEHKGAGILAGIMVVFTLYGERQLRKRDVEYYLDPRSAQEIKDADTLKLLEQQGAEATRSRF